MGLPSERAVGRPVASGLRSGLAPVPAAERGLGLASTRATVVGAGVLAFWA
jgi:hypothetical protein